MTQPSNKVLIVEDRSDWQEIVSSALARLGYTAQSSYSYQEALTALHSTRFDLAVIDPVLDMSNRFNRDGLSIVQKIRELQPEMSIIILTGSLTHDMDVSLKHLYPDAPVMFKESWDPEAFNRLVEQLVGQSFGMDAAPQTGPIDTLAESISPLMPPSPEKAAGRTRVLLVENRKDWQEIVAAVLEECDVFWRIARNAQEALDHLAHETFHLVILDLKLQPTELPLRSNEGWLLLDYLVEHHPKTQVVIISGRAGPRDVAALLTQYSVISYIEKQHFTPQAIKDIISRLIESPKLQLQTFGQFQIWRDGQAIGIWDHPQAEAIVKLLLVRRALDGRVVAADELLNRLWPDPADDQQHESLVSLINLARQTLEPEIEARDSHFIWREANGYLFNLAESVSWDLLEFRDLLKHGENLAKEAQWSAAISALEKGRAIYKGDFLAEDRLTSWVVDARREITGEFCRLLTQLADANAAISRYDEAIKACEEALEKDPLQEDVYRRLMQFHYCNGAKAQALKVYRNCLKVFEELFGESPSSTIRELHQAIVDDETLDCSENVVGSMG